MGESEGSIQWYHSRSWWGSQTGIFQLIPMLLIALMDVDVVDIECHHTRRIPCPSRMLDGVLWWVENGTHISGWLQMHRWWFLLLWMMLLQYSVNERRKSLVRRSGRRRLMVISAGGVFFTGPWEHQVHHPVAMWSWERVDYAEARMDLFNYKSFANSHWRWVVHWWCGVVGISTANCQMSGFVNRWYI